MSNKHFVAESNTPSYSFAEHDDSESVVIWEIELQ